MRKRAGKPPNVLLEKDLMGILLASIDDCQTNPAKYDGPKISPRAYPGFCGFQGTRVTFHDEIG